MLKGHEGNVDSAQFSPDGQHIVTTSDDKTVRIWPVENLDVLLARGCHWLNNYLIINPQTLNSLSTCQKPERIQAALPNLIAQSEALAHAGKITEAIAGFTIAKQWDPSLTFDPVEKANEERAKPAKLQAEVAKLQAEVAKLQAEADELLKVNQPDRAFTKLQEALKLNPELYIFDETWNSICWRGSLNGQAAIVLSACNEAVNGNSDNGERRDSRGLARALTGDNQGAIEDFQIYIQWLDRTKPEYAATRKAQRQSWIDDLRAGKSASAIFTKEVLEKLRNE
jgi:WD40 repeat protein